jgi:hypothetical protein
MQASVQKDEYMKILLGPKKRLNILVTSKSWLTSVLMILIAAAIALFTGLSQTLRMAPVKRMNLDTSFTGEIIADNMAPGDEVTEMVQLRNGGNKSIAYYLILIPEGELWDCDRRGSRLTYELQWSDAADQSLNAGELETVNIRVALAKTAGQNCMGKHGSLSIRTGMVEKAEDSGIFECGPLALASETARKRGGQFLASHFCRQLDEGHDFVMRK